MSINNKFLVISIVLGVMFFNISSSAMENINQEKKQENLNEANIIKSQNNEKKEDGSNIKNEVKENENKIKYEENKNESKIIIKNEKENKIEEKAEETEENLRELGYGDIEKDQQETKEWIKHWGIDNKEIYNEMKNNKYDDLLDCIKKYIMQKNRNLIECIKECENKKFCYKIVESNQSYYEKNSGYEEFEVDRKDLGEVLRIIQKNNLNKDVMVSYIEKVLLYDRNTREKIKTYGDLIKKAYTYVEEQNIELEKHERKYNIFDLDSIDILEGEYKCITGYLNFKRVLRKMKIEKEEKRDLKKEISDLYIEISRLQRLINRYEENEDESDERNFLKEINIYLNENSNNFIDELIEITNKTSDVFSFWKTLKNLLTIKYENSASVKKIIEAIRKEMVHNASFNEKNINNIVNILKGSVNEENLEKIKNYLGEGIGDGKKVFIFKEILEYLLNNYRVNFFENLDYVVENFEMIKEIEVLKINIEMLKEENIEKENKLKIMNAIEKIKEKINSDSSKKFEFLIKNFLENDKVTDADLGFFLDILKYIYDYEFYLYRKLSGEDTVQGVKERFYTGLEEIIEKNYDKKIFTKDIETILKNMKTAYENKDKLAIKNEVLTLSVKLKGYVEDETITKLIDLNIDKISRAVQKEFIMPAIVFIERGKEFFLRNFDKFLNNKYKQIIIEKEICDILDRVKRAKREITEKEKEAVKTRVVEFHSMDGLRNINVLIRKNSKGCYSIDIRLKCDDKNIENVETDSGAED